MLRQQIVIVVSATLIASCATAFRDRRTPSGEFCSDMAVIPAGQVPDREYHRLQPITSNPAARTEAQRLESLRNYAMVASGTAVTWVLRGEGAKPISHLPTHSKTPTQPMNPQPEPEPAPAPAPTESAAPAPQPTAAPKSGSTSKTAPITPSTARPPTPLVTTPPAPKK
ncbi:MAG: hypothetical protein L6Q76_15235 [Polyangiaceae bacterium]|nr:hypothetical protein [Polyangiaceae bacterium]